MTNVVHSLAKLNFIRSDFLSKHGFMEGQRLIDSEYPLVESMCDEVIQKLPIISGKWRIEKMCCDFHYLTFYDIGTEKRVEYFDLAEIDRREIDTAFNQAGLL